MGTGDNVSYDRSSEWSSLVHLLNRQYGPNDTVLRDSLGKPVAEVVGVSRDQWSRDHLMRQFVRHLSIQEIELGRLLSSDGQEFNNLEESRMVFTYNIRSGDRKRREIRRQDLLAGRPSGATG